MVAVHLTEGCRHIVGIGHHDLLIAELLFELLAYLLKESQGSAQLKVTVCQTHEEQYAVFDDVEVIPALLIHYS